MRRAILMSFATVRTSRRPLLAMAFCHAAHLHTHTHGLTFFPDQFSPRLLAGCGPEQRHARRARGVCGLVFRRKLEKHATARTGRGLARTGRKGAGWQAAALPPALGGQAGSSEEYWPPVPAHMLCRVPRSACADCGACSCRAVYYAFCRAVYYALIFFCSLLLYKKGQHDLAMLLCVESYDLI